MPDAIDEQRNSAVCATSLASTLRRIGDRFS